MADSRLCIGQFDCRMLMLGETAEGALFVLITGCAGKPLR